MKVIIGVENFGKIKKAEITLGRLLLFVGENNSGKTFMMQLLYGITSAIINDSKLLLKEATDRGSDYIVDEEVLSLWEKDVNQYLEKNKEQIVRDIFYKDIPIKKLYLKLDNINISYRVEVKKNKIIQMPEADSINYRVEFYKINKDKIINKLRMSLGGMFDKKSVEKFIAETIVGDIFGTRFSDSSLFLPASRTGMLLLYKYFFAEKDNKMYVFESNEAAQTVKNQLGLSAPVYKFLQFLLRFTPDSLVNDKNQKILDYIESNLIEGKLELSNDETYYIPENTEQRIPLYLSSSLINELAPIVKMLSSVYPYDNIYYDEIETCLHPLNQKAMARLIIRLVNSGRRMVISTHSDSMAINLNNLLTFTMGDCSENLKEQKIKDLGLEDEDILKTKDVHVYQFKNSSDGTSEVSELEFRNVNNLGYDFELFSQNLENLTEDTIKIME